MTVAAITAVLGGPRVLKRRAVSDDDLRTITREGIPASTISVLAEELGIDRATLARVVGISPRTLSRRLANGEKLTATESDRMVRVARVFALAKDTLSTAHKAALWLQSPNAVLEGHAPLELLDTDAGVRSVETILGRIEWGIYS